MDLTKTTANGRVAAYELLLHALNHEHTKDNYERHVLVLEKWCRETIEGLFICDLTYVVEVLQIIRERIALHPVLFTPVMVLLLKNCAQPLLESKANERMRPIGMDNIKSLYAELAMLWQDGSICMRTECARCFRVIVNGGKDPSILKADQVEWKSDGHTAQVTDISFIQGLLRESGALTAIVDEFRKSVDELLAEKARYLKLSTTLSELQTRNATSQEEDSDDDVSKTGNNSNRADRNDASGASTPNTAMGGSFENDLVDKIQSMKGDLIALQELIHVLIDLCLKLSTDTKNAASMCGMFVCDIAIKLLRDAATESPREPKVPICVEILWNCLESYLNQSMYYSNTLQSGLTSIDVMDFDVAIRSLRDVFLQLLMEGYRLADKDVRNEVVVLLTLIANFPGSIPYFLESGLLGDLVTYSCVGEAGKEGWGFFSCPLAKFRNFVSAFDVDIQLKKELWMLLSDILKFDDPDMIMCVASSPLVAVMLNYLEQTGQPGNTGIVNESTSLNGTDAGSQRSSTRPSMTLVDVPNFSDQNQTDDQFVEESEIDDSSVQMAAPAQVRELQILSIAFLAENAHRLMGEFMRIDGPIRIIEIILRYGSSSSTNNRSIIFHSLVLLNRCLLTSNVVKPKLVERKAIEVFLIQFESSEDESIRAQAARVMSIMCIDSVECQTQMRKLKGIRALTSTLSSYADSRRPNMGLNPASTDTEMESSGAGEGNMGDLSILAVAVLDCLWNSVAGNRKNEARFAQQEGIDALLDVIEVAPLLIRVQALRLLGDLLNNFRLVAFALAWRSAKTMRSAGQLFAHAWVEEENRLNSERNNGIICNLWDPLGSHRWPTDRPTPMAQSEISGNASTSTQSVSGVSVSSLVSKLTSAVASNRNQTTGGATGGGGGGGNAGLPPEVNANLLKLDVRGIIANALALLGLLNEFNNESPSVTQTLHIPEVDENGEEEDVNFSLADGPGKEPGGVKDDSLTPSDLQVISMAARYGVLREGQWWQQIFDELHSEGIVPVEADAYLISQKLEKLFEAARSVQFEQMELKDVAHKQKQAQEEIFIGHIIQQKNQQLKSEFLKKKAQNAKVHLTTKVKLTS